MIRKAAYIWLAIIIVLILWHSFALTKIPVTGPSNISTTFRGYTNDATAARLARFTVSNLTGSAVYCYRPFIEVNTTNGLDYLRGNNTAWRATLDRDVSTDFTIPVPTNHSRWKLTFLVYSPTGMERQLKQAANSVSVLLRLTQPYRNMPYKIETDWIEATRRNP